MENEQRIISKEKTEEILLFLGFRIPGIILRLHSLDINIPKRDLGVAKVLGTTRRYSIDQNGFRNVMGVEQRKYWRLVNRVRGDVRY